jgi:hypothetical protein
VAEIIASDAVKYPPGSLMATIAEMTLRGGVNIRQKLERRAGLRRGGGLLHEDPRRQLGPRAAHCFGSSDCYELIDADPAASTGLIEGHRAEKRRVA